MKQDCGNKAWETMERYGAESWGAWEEHSEGARARPPEPSRAMLREISRDARHPLWSEFVKEYWPMMEAFLRSKRVPECEREDVIQEAFAAVAEELLRKPYCPGEKGSFTNWLTGVLKHKMMDASRAAWSRERNVQRFGEHEVATGRLKTALDYDNSDGESGRVVHVLVSGWRDSGTRREERAKSVCRAALRRLLADEGVTGRNREVCRRLWGRMESGEAVAAALEMSRNAVYQVGSRMMRRLREMVGRMMEESARCAQ